MFSVCLWLCVSQACPILHRYMLFQILHGLDCSSKTEGGGAVLQAHIGCAAQEGAESIRNATRQPISTHKPRLTGISGGFLGRGVTWQRPYQRKQVCVCVCEQLHPCPPHPFSWFDILQYLRSGVFWRGISSKSLAVYILYETEYLFLWIFLWKGGGVGEFLVHWFFVVNTEQLHSKWKLELWFSEALSLSILLFRLLVGFVC